MKYNSIRTGQFKSRAEALIWAKLRRLKKKVLAKYEDTKLSYIVLRDYIPDFTVYQEGKAPLYIEVKGFFRPEDRSKMLAVKRSHPGADIRLVFMADSKLNKRSKTRYSDWAIRHEFPYSIGHIPGSWF